MGKSRTLDPPSVVDFCDIAYVIVYHRGVVHNWGLRLGGSDKVGQAQPDTPSMRMWIGLKFSCLPNIRDCIVVRIPHYINIYSILHRIEHFNEKTKLRIWPRLKVRLWFSGFHDWSKIDIEPIREGAFTVRGGSRTSCWLVPAETMIGRSQIELTVRGGRGSRTGGIYDPAKAMSE